MITRYVNTASTAGGSGITNDITGDDRAFVSLDSAKNWFNANNPLASDNVTILCCGAAADTTWSSSAAWSLAAGSYKLLIEGNPDHPNGAGTAGYWDETKYRYYATVGSESVLLPFSSSGASLEIRNIQIRMNYGYGKTIALYNNLNVTIKNVVIVGNGGWTQCIWFNSYNSSLGALNLSNSVICGTTSMAVTINCRNYSIYNNIIVGSNYQALVLYGGNYEYRRVVNNTLIVDGNEIVTGGTAPQLLNYNAGTISGELGTNPVIVSDWASQFYNPNYINDFDFRFKSSSLLRDAGIGPAADAYVPVTDIIGDERNGSIASIGPFQNPYAPLAGRNTKLDYRFLKVATDPGLENDGANAIRVKVKTGGGVLLDSTGLSIDRSQINEVKIIEYTISASDMTLKGFTLETPMASTNQIALTVYGGLPVNYGSDYTAVDSTTVGWDGLGLDGLIDVGDEVQVTYSV